MKFSAFVSGSVALAGLLSGAIASPHGVYARDISPRALPNAPDGYTPTSVDCPASRPSIRSAAGGLSPNETAWLPKRRKQTTSALKDFFGHVKIDNFDAVSYINQHSSNTSLLPNVAIAVSGGGYRALTNGAGAIKAFDSRTSNSTASGQVGGLLQSATYVAGLSGGSWLLGSIYVNNFSTIASLQTHDKGDIWQFENSILEGPDGSSIQVVDSAEYWTDLHDAVKGKDDAGFPVAITDYWGRALSYQLVYAKNGGLDYTWSSIALTSDFQQGNIPMPLVVTDNRYSHETLIGSNTTVMEINPWEFGTFDPTIYGFAPLEYLGSRFVGGVLPQNESCVRGFDNAGFIMGTSSTLFNQFILQLNNTKAPSLLKDVVGAVLEKIGEDNKDVALYGPNPFYQFHNSSNPDSAQTVLNQVDGGEDNQNIPLQPLIQPERHVDVIFAVDSSADTEHSWPNGSSLVTTYERSLNATGIGNHTAFPAVPDVNTFINLGLNSRPTFFGCNSSNTSSPAPLIVYLPNHPYVTDSNTSTFQLSYTDSQRDDIILNGYNVVTMGNSTLDANWSTCVGCAVLSRSFERTNTNVPDVCNKCFNTYCWNGTVNSTDPAPFLPAMALGDVSTKDNVASVNGPTMLAVMAAAAAAVVSVL
ncbi:Lysophospholipase 1 [Monascus purpureus]|nr:Lysophospholipase 1 [Monascus purpureus]